LRLRQCKQLTNSYLHFFYYKYSNMLRYAIIFFVVALIAGVLGFGGIASGLASIAQILFYIFLVLLVVSLVSSLFKKA